jgi:preprotein translocase subunit SecB
MKERNMPLLLELETHFFTKVMVEAVRGYNPEKEGKYAFDTNIDIGQHKENPRRWQVILGIQTKSKTNLPYKIKLECVGLFKVSSEVEEDKMGHLVRANGAAILYSSAREFLLLITGRGPWAPFYLPTTNFLTPPEAKKERVMRKKLDDSTATPQTKQSKE